MIIWPKIFLFIFDQKSENGPPYTWPRHWLTARRHDYQTNDTQENDTKHKSNLNTMLSADI